MANKKIDARIAKATQAHCEAKRNHITLRGKQSADLLADLLTKPLKERFAALAPDAQGSVTLVASDRLKLLKSIGERAGRERTIDVGFASRFEVFRSRLRYRSWTFIVSGILLAAVVASFAVALMRTPRMWVEVVGPSFQKTSVLHPDGSKTDETIYPSSERYQLMRIEGDVALLRKWVAGSGYEYFSVPVEALQASSA